MRGWLATLNRRAREGLLEKGVFESRLEGSDRRAMGVPWRRVLQVEELANSKALGLGCIWVLRASQEVPITRGESEHNFGSGCGFRVISKGGAGDVGSWRPW